MNKKEMNEVVKDFRAQWSEDFRRAMEREPERYTLKIEMGTIEISDFSGVGNRFYVEITDWLNQEKGLAICNPSDKVDILLGQAIAWARLNNIPLPKQLKPNRITTFKKLKVGKSYSYPDAINGSFTVISRNMHEDNLIYTIYFPEKKRYNTIACSVHNSLDMHRKFIIC